MTVMIGSPILRNRAWILPKYLEHLYNINFPKKEVHLAFLLNGLEEDNTGKILWDFAKKHQNEYRRIDIWEKDDDATDSRMRQRDYQHFADVRNEWLTMRRKSDTHLFSVDSDVLVERDTLTKLLSHGKSIVSALICNGSIGEQNVFYNILNEDGDIYIHQKPSSPLMQIDVTGACYIIRRNLLDEGLQYSNHPQGEDCGFCKTAKDMGYKLFCDITTEPRHVMFEEDL